MEAATWEVLLGPAGALALALLAILALVRYQWIVPGTFYTAALERAQMLEAENRNLNSAVIELTRQSGHLEGEVAFLRTEINSLRAELRSLRGGEKQ